MQGLTLIGSGWHPHLFRAEIKALTGPLEVIHPRVVYIPHTDSAIRRLSRAALLDEVLSSAGRVWLHTSITDGELAQHIAEWAGSNLPKGSFAVRARNLGTGIDGLSRSAIEGEVGALVMSEANPVDLESPEHEIVVVLAGPEDGPIHRDSMSFIGPKVVWGIRESAWQRESFAGRAPTDRPFFQPVSLDPRQARLLISLAHRAGVESTTVVDPFCGTGGIAIEAALQGLETLASDLDGRMVEGTRQNLDWAGVSASVEMSAVADVASVWGERSGCIFAFDPPYGRSSWKSDDGLELLLEAMSAAHQIDSQGAVCTMLPAGPETLSQESEQDYQVMGRPWGEVEALIQEHGWVPVLKSPIRVHRSLARMVVVCHPAD